MKAAYWEGRAILGSSGRWLWINKMGPIYCEFWAAYQVLGKIHLCIVHIIWDCFFFLWNETLKQCCSQRNISSTSKVSESSVKLYLVFLEDSQKPYNVSKRKPCNFSLNIPSSSLCPSFFTGPWHPILHFAHSCRCRGIIYIYPLIKAYTPCTGAFLIFSWTPIPLPHIMSSPSRILVNKNVHFTTSSSEKKICFCNKTIHNSFRLDGKKKKITKTGNCMHS